MHENVYNLDSDGKCNIDTVMGSKFSTWSGVIYADDTLNKWYEVVVDIRD